MTNSIHYHLHKFLTLLIALVWIVNGLFCKVFNLVPRHREIVAVILGREHAVIFTLLIGFAELIMAAWIICRYQPRWSAITQVVVIATMNILEFIKVPQLLLWGKWNIVFAFLFIILICFNEIQRVKLKC